MTNTYFALILESQPHTYGRHQSPVCEVIICILPQLNSFELPSYRKGAIVGEELTLTSRFDYINQT